jgi:hypothetical protein
MEMYPIIFMHIAFYETYMKHCCGNLNILDFKSCFSQYQKYSIEKYSRMTLTFYNKISNFKPFNDLSDLMEDLRI